MSLGLSGPLLSSDQMALFSDQMALSSDQMAMLVAPLAHGRASSEQIEMLLNAVPEQPRPSTEQVTAFLKDLAAMEQQQWQTGKRPRPSFEEIVHMLSVSCVLQQTIEY